MKVLPTQDVYNLGHAGDVKTIADGYGRNYLLPRNMAVLATSGAIKSAERIKMRNVERRARNHADIAAQAAVIGGITVYIHGRTGEKGKLFGSVTAANIADELSKKLGSEFDKRKIGLREPIREVGTYTVAVRLATEVTPNITVVVLPEGAPISEAAAVVPAEPAAAA